MNPVSMAVAGMCVELRPEPGSVELVIPERYRPFVLRSPPTTDAVIEWRAGDPDAVPTGELLYDPGLAWRMYRSAAGDGLVARFVGFGDPHGPSLAAMWANPKWNRISITERAGAAASREVLAHGLGELALRTRLLFFDAIAVHASSVEDAGRAFLFLGQSGAGKSTQARIWAADPNVALLATDRVALRLTDDGVVAYGTPWARREEPVVNRSAPAAALLFLEQSPLNSLRPLPPSAAAAALLSRAYLPYWDVALLDRAMQVAHEVVQRLPAFRMRCRPDWSAVEMVRGAL
jgi:hypothetical protein